MERLPIKFFSKREEDKMRVEGGPQNLPGFVLEGEALSQKSQLLNAELNSLCADIDWNGREDIPYVFKAKMNKDALAKSHRGRITTLFSGEGRDNIIGMTSEDTLLVMVQSQAVVDEISSKINNPTKYAYEVSCVDSISKFSTEIYCEEDIDDYKVKLINFQDYSLNNALVVRFEQCLKEHDIKFLRTQYTSDLTVYKLCKANKTILDELAESRIFDITEEIVPMPKVVLSLDGLEDEERIPIKYPVENRKYTIVGVLDNGIAEISELTPWIDGKMSKYPENLISATHGTKVASIITYGDLLMGTEVVGNKNVKVFDAVVFPDTTKESLDEDDLIRNIQDIVRAKRNEVKVWNLSISITREIQDGKFSDFAKALDALQDECNVLICKSAGNCTNFSKGKAIGRIHEGADSVRSLVVGSLAKEKVGEDIALEDNPSPFSRIGPGPAYIVKPDMVHYGGNARINNRGEIIETDNKTISKNGKVTHSSGTSFSTPRVSALAAELHNSLAEEFDPLLLKALMIHSCYYPTNISMPVNERTKYTGYGIPKKVSQILYNSPYEATLILRDTLAKGQYVDIKDFPMPDCLCRDGFYEGQIVVTLVYDPVLEPSQGFEYCQSNMDVKFGSYDEKVLRDTTRPTILNPVGKEGNRNVLLESFYSKRKSANNQDEFAKMERLLIKYGDKYYPVKKYAVDLANVTDGNRVKYLSSDKKWFLTIDGAYRYYSEQKAIRNSTELSQEFCMIISIRDPKGEADVYTGVTQKLDEYNFWHSNIQVDTTVVVQV